MPRSVPDSNRGECKNSDEHGIDQHGYPHAVVLNDGGRSERLKQQVEYNHGHAEITYESGNILFRKHDRRYVQEGVIHERNHQHGHDDKRRHVQHVSVAKELQRANFSVVLSFVSEVSCFVYMAGRQVQEEQNEQRDTDQADRIQCRLALNGFQNLGNREVSDKRCDHRAGVYSAEQALGLTRIEKPRKRPPEHQVENVGKGQYQRKAGKIQVFGIGDERRAELKECGKPEYHDNAESTKYREGYSVLQQIVTDGCGKTDNSRKQKRFW